MTDTVSCPLCEQAGGDLVVQGPQWRIVLADDAGAQAFPGFTRVIWQEHCREMTDLEAPSQAELMQVVFAVETLMREHLQPDKINLASLGNQVDHLHWHIIPRWRADSHFPSPVWAAAYPARDPFKVAAPVLARYRQALQDTLAPSVWSKRR